MADFVNEHGLKNIGNARFNETPESGAPTFGAPKERTIGKIQAGFLEKSNTEVKSFMDDIDKDEENKVIEILKKYFIETSIHGLKYIFEGGRHTSERIFWIIAELFLLIFCFYLLSHLI